MIQTVLGPIRAEQLGRTLIHEHIYCGSPEFYHAFGERFYPREALIDLAVKRLRAAREEYGLGAMVDGTPCNLGRDVSLLAEVSRASGVHIIASSGMYYTEDAYLAGKTPERLARLFLDECRNGMEETYRAARPVLPGILKCATGQAGFTPTNDMLLRMMGIVQRETGLPMFAHNEHALHTATRQIEIFKESGVDLSRVIIGHASDSGDIPYLESLLKEGVFLGFDRLWPSEAQAETVCRLLERGWGDRLLLSRDGAVFLNFGSQEWGGAEKIESQFTAVLAKFAAMLARHGVPARALDAMLIENPKRALDA